MPRQPRRGPARTARPGPVAQSAPRPRRSPASRAWLTLLGLLALGGIIAAIVFATSPAPTKITLRNVVYSDVQESAEALKQLVSENTK